MASQSPEHEELLRENEELTLRLREAEETLEAIRSGEVDALVVDTPGGEEHLFTLEAADHVYRIFLESITEGALTLSGDGYILYANEAAGRLCESRRAACSDSRSEAACARTTANASTPSSPPRVISRRAQRSCWAAQTKGVPPTCRSARWTAGRHHRRRRHRSH